MKKFWAGMLCGLILTFAMIGLAEETFYKGKTVFAKIADAKILERPDGAAIATVGRGTPMIILQQNEKWLLVALNGVIPKDAVTGTEGALRGSAFRAYMILAKDLAAGQEILKELQGGADFQAVARAKSAAPNKATGGDLGDAYPGDLSSEFEKIILGLKVGEVSPVLKTSLGYQIFKRVK
jgi:parvulin-like peptidyl-prolyl isomerase